MSNHAEQIAEGLLEIQAVKLQPRDPFTWSSGWRSPIYCDNRLTLSYPAVRERICAGFVALANAQYAQTGAVCGVATGGVPHGMLVADRLALPYLYVRPNPKSHGLKNQVEGRIVPSQPILVIEDLVSTGKSSMNAIQALRDAGAVVLGLVSIFHYGFAAAEELFAQHQVPFSSLCTLNDLLGVAQRRGAITQADADTIARWRRQPDTWQAV